MAFLRRLAPNGQPWNGYCGAAPPAADGDGRLVGAWGECMNAAVIFEITNPNWPSLDGFQDGPVGQVIEFCCHCGYGAFTRTLEEAEESMKEEMGRAQGDPFAFLQHRARNGRTWKEYCAPMEPSHDARGFINGAWGECLTAAVIFEHQNPEWSRLPMYMADGPAGQVINFFLQLGHEPHEGAMNGTEAATHEAMNHGQRVPVFEEVYQAVQGTSEAPHVNEQPPAMTGRKKAFLVGCNYPGTTAKLNGCINDVHMWKELLSDVYGFDQGNMVLLTDDQAEQMKKPSLANIRSGLCWLVAGAQPGDVLFFQFSGHGTQVASRSGGEADGKDEALVPGDFKEAGFLVDDEIFDLIVTPLQSGVKLTIILDCCHSGTAVDLPFIWNGDRDSWDQECGAPLTAGDVQMFSGCEDNQCSMDVTRHGRAGGAMTTSMNQAIREEPNRTYPDLLQRLHDILEERRMTQVPRLTSSQQFDVRSKNFSLCEGAVPNGNPVLGLAGPPRHQGRDGEVGSFLSGILGM